MKHRHLEVTYTKILYWNWNIKLFSAFRCWGCAGITTHVSERCALSSGGGVWFFSFKQNTNQCFWNALIFGQIPQTYKQKWV